MSQHSSFWMAYSGPRAPTVWERFDADDLGVACVAFTVTAAGFLVASSLFDLMLCWLLCVPVSNVDLLAAHQVASEALPLSLLFTALASGLTMAGLRLRSAASRYAGPHRVQGAGFVHFTLTRTA